MAESARSAKIKKNCDVVGCSETAERSMSSRRIEKSGLEIVEGVGKRASLCRRHYREFKKKTKKDRELESLGW